MSNPILVLDNRSESYSFMSTICVDANGDQYAVWHGTTGNGGHVLNSKCGVYFSRRKKYSNAWEPIKRILSPDAAYAWYTGSIIPFVENGVNRLIVIASKDNWNNIYLSVPLTYSIVSSDGGDTWSAPVQVSTKNLACLVHGCLTETNRIIVPMQLWTRDCEFGVSYSDDFGATWTYSQIIADQRGTGRLYNEASIFQLSDKLVLFTRDETAPNTFGKLFSYDNGVTWTAPVKIPDVPVPNGHQACPMVCKNWDGSYLFSYAQMIYKFTDVCDTFTEYINYDPTATYGYPSLCRGQTSNKITVSFTSKSRWNVLQGQPNTLYAPMYVYTQDVNILGGGTMEYKVDAALPNASAPVSGAVVPICKTVGINTPPDTAGLWWDTLSDTGDTLLIGGGLPKTAIVRNRGAKNAVFYTKKDLATAGNVVSLNVNGSRSTAGTTSLFADMGFYLWYDFLALPGPLVDRCGNYNGTVTGYSLATDSPLGGGGFAYTAATNKITAGNVTQINSATAFTIIFLAKTTATGVVTVSAVDLSTNARVRVYFHSDGFLYTDLGISTAYRGITRAPWIDGNYHLHVIRYNGSAQTFSHRVDKVTRAITATSGAIPPALPTMGAEPFLVGNVKTNNLAFNGTLGLYAMSSQVLSDAYVDFLYDQIMTGETYGDVSQVATGSPRTKFNLGISDLGF